MPASNNIIISKDATTYTLLEHISKPGQDVIKFHESLPQYTQTPLISLHSIAQSIGLKQVLIKDERRRFGVPSFKPLGIAWAMRNALIAELSESLLEPLSQNISLADLAAKTKEARIKLVTATDGKLGRIVARLGKWFGIEGINTRVFVSSELDERVKNGIREEGAEVIEVDGDMEVVVREAWLHSVATDGVMVAIDAEEGYIDFPKWVVEGYSTIFEELDQQLDQPPDLIVLPVGVGGLAQAAVTHYKSTESSSRHPVRILTVEPDGGACLFDSLSAGKRVTVQPKDTIMKHMNYEAVSETAWDVLKTGVDYSAVVEDREVMNAIEDLVKLGSEVGPCGGAVLAALNLLNSRERGNAGLGDDSLVVLVCTDSPED